MKQRAVFYDRDGTLIVDKHYMHEVSKIEYYDDSFTALKQLQDKGFKLFIVTNQSGIGRGMFNENQMHEVHEQIVQDYKDQGIEILDIEFCPHCPDQNCECRKPKPLMLERLAKKHNIDLTKSFMIGDKVSDGECGKNCGAQGLLLKVSDDRFKTFENLQQITNYILS
ncbi:MAG: HAD family hydrolase [Bacteriovoracaceae bacterium]|jgi:D-glycero-D-manno-heptose 1,7-bisphosphate phosphatase|nr:HAD family hydrolase [Bacteriovoracaceae bacterium]